MKLSLKLELSQPAGEEKSSEGETSFRECRAFGVVKTMLEALGKAAVLVRAATGIVVFTEQG